MPTDDIDLSYTFSATDYTAVATDNGVYYATDGTNNYMIVMFKNQITPNQQFTVSWNGQTDLAPTSSTVYLQILDRNSNTWVTLSSNNNASANSDFTIGAVVSTNLSHYPDASNIISCRVYQELIYD